MTKYQTTSGEKKRQSAFEMLTYIALGAMREGFDRSAWLRLSLRVWHEASLRSGGNPGSDAPSGRRDDE